MSVGRSMKTLREIADGYSDGSLSKVEAINLARKWAARTERDLNADIQEKAGCNGVLPWPTYGWRVIKP